MAIDYSRDSDLLRTMGHPARLRILHGLMTGECDVSKIVKSLKIPQSTVSQHLGILRITKIIRARKEGVRTCYRIIDDKVRKILSVLK